MAKVNISIPDALLSRVDEYADNHYMSRSGVLTLAANQLVQAEEISSAIRSISASMAIIADKNELDEEAKAEFQKMQVLVSLLYSAKK